MFLIVDDQRLACLRLKDLLLECGIEPDAVAYEMKPAQALELLGQAVFDLVFLDIEMPGMSGLELWQCLKARGFKGQVICTTAHDQYILEALRAHALDYLLKPVQADELKAALQRFYENSAPPARDFNKLVDFGLTQRQVEIARRIFEGKTSLQIGEDLFLSKHTVDTHRRNILRQTGCKNTTELFKLL